MKTLDRQKSYGTIHGDTEGRVYEQDGAIFDAEGNEWQSLAPPIPEPTPQVDDPAKKKK